MISTLTSIPDKLTIIRTFLLTWLFCLPFSGTMDLFVFIVTGQLIFLTLVFTCLKDKHPSILDHLKKQQPISYWLFILWVIATLISCFLVFTSPTNGWQRLAALIRQAFIFIQIGFCFALARYLMISQLASIRILISFACGVIGLILLHFLVLTFGHRSEANIWISEPFLSPNMRDIGNLATGAIMIFGALFWLSQHRFKQALFLSGFIISWAYLFWSGGRTGIAITLICNGIAIMALTFKHQITYKKICITFLAIGFALLLCHFFSIYEWNGLARYSNEWTKNNLGGDLTNGRMDAWKWSIAAWKMQPWFGLGPYSFFFIPERYATAFYHDHPHNLIIQCLIEWGIVGTILFLAFLSSILLSAVKKLRTPIHTSYLATMSIIVSLSLESMVSGSYWDFQPVIILVISYAILPLAADLRPPRLNQHE